MADKFLVVRENNCKLYVCVRDRDAKERQEESKPMCASLCEGKEKKTPKLSQLPFSQPRTQSCPAAGATQEPQAKGLSSFSGKVSFWMCHWWVWISYGWKGTPFVIVKLEAEAASEVSVRLSTGVCLVASQKAQSHLSAEKHRCLAACTGRCGVFPHFKVWLCHLLMITQHQHQLIETILYLLKCEQEITLTRNHNDHWLILQQAKAEDSQGCGWKINVDGEGSLIPLMY